MSAVADAARMEWVRLRTLRSTYVLTGTALTLAAGIAVLVGLNSREHLDRAVIVQGLTAGAPYLPLTAAFAGILGVLAVGHDYSFGLARPVLTTVPRRSALLAGRLAVLLGAAGALALGSLALNAVGLAGGLGHGFDVGGTTWRPLAGYVLQLLLWALLGAGLTLVLRTITGAVVILLVVPTIGEPILAAALSTERLQALNPVVRYLPFRAGLAIVNPNPLADDPQALTRLQSGLLFTAFAAVVLALGWTAFVRRDA